MRDHYDFLVVGSGLYGSVFAHEAVKKGKSVLVLEKRNHQGGNIYTERRDGIDIHRYGAHIFHTSDKAIWDYVNDLVPFKNFINSPIANYKGRILNMPFNMNTFSRLWDIATPEEALTIIEEQRKEIKGEPKNLEETAISLVGRDIYEILVKGYTEKQWGRDCKDLPSSIIKRLPVRLTYDNNYFNDNWQGIPRDGYTAIIDKLLSGSDLLLSVDYLEDKGKWDSMADKVLYTGMLDRLYGFCYGELQYRSEKFAEERIEKENWQGVAVVNYTDRETPYTRIIEHKHFLGQKSSVTWISKEYPVDYSETGEPFYSVNDDRNNALYAKYKALSDADSKLIIGGRLAEYAYYDMDKTIARALEKARQEIV